MVLKTAEGISGIAEESPGVNLFVPQKWLLLPSWQAEASQPCRRAVTNGLARLPAFSWAARANDRFLATMCSDGFSLRYVGVYCHLDSGFM